MGSDQRLCPGFQAIFTSPRKCGRCWLPFPSSGLARAAADGHADRPVRRTHRIYRLFLIVAAAAAIVPTARDFNQLVLYAFLLGLAGSSFAIGVGFVSPWFPPEQQGTALGIYGLGNMGHSAAVFLGPVIAACYRPAYGVPRHGGLSRRLGRRLLRCSRAMRRARGRRRDRRDAAVLTRERLSWVLSGVLLPDLRRLCRLLDLSADAAARRVRPDACRTPASARRDSSCSRRCCGRSAAGSPTASAARGCCPASSSGSCLSRCC